MQPRRLWAFTRFLFTFLALFGAWLLFSSRTDRFSLIAGAAGALIIALLTFRVFIAEHDAALHGIIPRPLPLVLFFFYLIGSLYASSFRVLRGVITRRPSPRIVHFRTRLRTDMARMVLCNSITFTPGTMTLDLNDDHLTVHWFFATTSHSRAAGEAVKGRMEKILGRIWS